MCTTYICFLAALLALESGWDRDRYNAGAIQDWQLTQWAGGSVGTFYPNHKKWSELTDAEWQDMSYRSTNSLGFVGYQFGEAMLIDLGYYKDDVYYGGGSGQASNTWDGTWTGKHDVKSLEDFKTGKAQTYAIQEELGYNLQVLESQLAVYGKTLSDFIGTTKTYKQDGKDVTVKLTLSGILAATHLSGAWGTASLLLNDAATTDESGISILQYIRKFGGYDVPTITALIAFYGGKVTSDTGVGSLLLPDPKPQATAANTGDPATPVEDTDSGQCSGKWYSARLTNFNSYPEAGSNECDQFNGCEWTGQFYGEDGPHSEAWVRQHNIVAVHMKDWDWLGNQTLRLRQDSRIIVAQAIDACADSDCDNCCTKNLGGDGYLIDIEKSTMQRFQSGDGLVDFQLCNAGMGGGTTENGGAVASNGGKPSTIGNQQGTGVTVGGTQNAGGNGGATTVKDGAVASNGGKPNPSTIGNQQGTGVTVGGTQNAGGNGGGTTVKDGAVASNGGRPSTIGNQNGAGGTSGYGHNAGGNVGANNRGNGGRGQLSDLDHSGDGAGRDGAVNSATGGSGTPEANIVLASGSDALQLTYDWGNFRTVAGFDPKEDVIDFGSLPGSDVLIEETGEGLKISVNNSGGSGYLLQGVSAADLSVPDNVTAAFGNPVITEPGGIADQLRKLGQQGKLTDTATPGTLDTAPTDPDTPDADIALASGSDTLQVTYDWGNFRTVAGFDPKEDIIDFGFLPGSDVVIEETGEDLKISVNNNGGNGYLLKGVSAADLSVSHNITAAFWNPAVTQAGGIADRLREYGASD
jgi:hypothetical protein